VLDDWAKSKTKAILESMIIKGEIPEEDWPPASVYELKDEFKKSTNPLSSKPQTTKMFTSVNCNLHYHRLRTIIAGYLVRYLLGYEYSYL
jgi:hypothetical protein